MQQVHFLIADIALLCDEEHYLATGSKAVTGLIYHCLDYCNDATPEQRALYFKRAAYTWLKG